MKETNMNISDKEEFAVGTKVRARPNAPYYFPETLNTGVVTRRGEDFVYVEMADYNQHLVKIGMASLVQREMPFFPEELKVVSDD